MTTISLESFAASLVQREVHLCLSSMVSTLASGYGNVGQNRPDAGLADLTEQAFELACPVLDYAEAARQAGWSARADGIFVINAGTDDEDDTSSGIDANGPNAWENLCAEHGIDPYEWEVFEHWAVSSWLAEQLAAAGERVDTDFAGLNVWARTTTGQSISMDGVIQRIAADLMAA